MFQIFIWVLENLQEAVEVFNRKEEAECKEPKGNKHYQAAWRHFR